MALSEKLKGRLVTAEQGLRFKQSDKKELLEKLENLIKEIKDYEEEIQQLKTAIPLLKDKGL